MHNVKAIGRKLAGSDGSLFALTLGMSLMAACFQLLGRVEDSQHWLYRCSRAGVKDGHSLFLSLSLSLSLSLTHLCPSLSLSRSHTSVVLILRIYFLVSRSIRFIIILLHDSYLAPKEPRDLSSSTCWRVMSSIVIML